VAGGSGWWRWTLAVSRATAGGSGAHRSYAIMRFQLGFTWEKGRGEGARDSERGREVERAVRWLETSARQRRMASFLRLVIAAGRRH
jgi:hypothetical protein